MQTLSILSTRASTAQAQQKTFITRVGRTLPGVIDPAAVLTATGAGASFGYSLGWVSENLWLSFAATSMLIPNLLFFWTQFLLGF